MNLHESAMSLLCISLHAQRSQRVANWKRWLWHTLANNGNGVQPSPGMLGLALQASNGFDLKQSVQCNVMAKHGQICLTSTALQNVSSQEIVHTAGIREKQWASRELRASAAASGDAGDARLPAFSNEFFAPVVDDFIDLPMPKWSQMDPNGHSPFRRLQVHLGLSSLLFCSVLFGSCALCPCKCGGAFTQHSVLKSFKRKQKVKHCPHELLRFLPGFAGKAISISQIQSDLTHHIFTNSGRFWSYTGLDHPGPLTLKKESPTHHLGQITPLCSKLVLVLNFPDCAQKCPDV